MKKIPFVVFPVKMFTPIKLFNSSSNKIELLLQQNLNWYTCGPTVYNDSHIGHARTFITLDALMRTMKRLGYRVTTGMNITDIDDKILHRVKVEHWRSLITDGQEVDALKLEAHLITKFQLEEMNPVEIVRKMTPSYEQYKNFIQLQRKSFWQDMDALEVQPPDFVINISDIIPPIINFITELLNKELAYVSNESVYFDTVKYKELYGACALGAGGAEELARVSQAFASEKRNSADFTLWKRLKKYEIGFQSPWGIGRVSWHAECSTVVDLMFGDKLDIHAGGIDLKFPHHHNECLQSVALTENKEWCNTFIHTGHLHINAEKMSQSLNNFVTIKKLLATVSARAVRTMFLSYKWNATMNYDDNSIRQALELDTKIYSFIKFVENVEASAYNNRSIADLDMIEQIASFGAESLQCLIADFDTPQLFSLIRKFINYVYANQAASNNLKKRALNSVIEALSNVGLDYTDAVVVDAVASNAEIIVDIRERLKDAVGDVKLKHRVYEINDYIRDTVLPKLGYRLVDAKGEVRLVKL